MSISQAHRGKFASTVSLIRPANSIMVGLAVVVGIGVASNSLQQIFSFVALSGFLTGFSISSFSMISNDIYDLEVDKINQPTRPLASGETSIRTASILASCYLAVGLVASSLLGFFTFVIAILFAFVGWSYNYYAKKLGLFGNSLVAASVAIPYIYGSVSLSNYGLNLAYLLALTSFFAGLGREVLKGISDVAGDKVRNIRSIAMVFGSKSAKQIAAALFLVAVASSSLPLIFGLLGHALWIYIILILVPDGIFLFLSMKVVRMHSDLEARRLKSIALFGMLGGLLAYFIAGLTH